MTSVSNVCHFHLSNVLLISDHLCLLMFCLFSLFFCLPSFFNFFSFITPHHRYTTIKSLFFFFTWPVCTSHPAGFIKSPLSQLRLTDDDAELHCEVIGDPIPEVQWWFIEGEEHNETYTQLYDGAWDERIHINSTYVTHATSTIYINSLALNDSGTYECRASNDPDRNELKKTPRIKWIRSQANIIVIQREWQLTRQEQLGLNNTSFLCVRSSLFIYPIP